MVVCCTVFNLCRNKCCIALVITVAQNSSAESQSICSSWTHVFHQTMLHLFQHWHTNTLVSYFIREKHTLHPFQNIVWFYQYPEICPVSGQPAVYYTGSRLHPANHNHIHQCNNPFNYKIITNNQSRLCDFYTTSLYHSGAQQQLETHFRDKTRIVTVLFQYHVDIQIILLLWCLTSVLTVIWNYSYYTSYIYHCKTWLFHLYTQRRV